MHTRLYVRTARGLSSSIVLVLVLVLVLDPLFSVEAREPKRSPGIDYENEDEDEDDWEIRNPPERGPDSAGLHILNLRGRVWYSGARRKTGRPPLDWRFRKTWTGVRRRWRGAAA